MDADTFIRAIPMPCAVIGADQRLAALNPAAERLFGGAVLGRHYAAVFRQPALLDRIETVMQTRVPAQARHIASGEARERLYDVSITPLDAGMGTILAFDDVTALEEAGEMRSEFVANVSHELRTPLTAISGFVETLRGPARDDAAAREHFLKIMESETRRMHRLVDDLLSLAKVEDTEGLRPTEQQDVAELLLNAALNLQGQADDRLVQLHVRGCDAPVMAPADPDQLTQVFTNLIENAIKYGGSGGEVTVTLSQVQHDPRLRGPGLIVAVTDKGEGIDERHLGRLTERFYRVDDHRSRGMGGTGLGLAIVKHIVNRHRGRLRIESTPGQGSTFSVALPTR
ncbi:ATP-binding protein [Maritimibacter alkaliphilus]|uniref:histidine kinase n=2 Tax=Maritimibacter TaxID=404235 RepID=A3VE25_9RHOB|nr:ATP-binding protein [Maritimibacter alkaliphilus]EAQ13764.1 phosphate regulon sensor histidine kinase, putative [Maritimibacter alkaliphilus HTCC2654]